jgi:hypothetical protein
LPPLTELALSFPLKKINHMNILKRLQSPTPKFYRGIRNLGLVLSAISSSILAGAGHFPGLLVTIAGYLAVAAAIATAISQTVTFTETEASKDTTYKYE